MFILRFYLYLMYLNVTELLQECLQIKAINQEKTVINSVVDPDPDPPGSGLSLFFTDPDP